MLLSEEPVIFKDVEVVIVDAAGEAVVDNVRAVEGGGLELVFQLPDGLAGIHAECYMVKDDGAFEGLAVRLVLYRCH